MQATLQQGELWVDDSPRKTLEEKVSGALIHYKNKTGKKATVVLVNPKAIDEATRINGVVVAPARHVLLHHFFVGVGTVTT